MDILNILFLCYLGGALVRRSCDEFMKTSGELPECGYFVGPGGSLNCGNIFHIVCPSWKGGQDKEEEKLGELIFKSLNQASIRHMKSIAVPAVGCGNYG